MPEWKEYRLGDYAEITSSKRIFYSDYVLEGIPFFRSKEIIERSLGEAGGEPLYISKEKYLEIKKTFGAPTEGDLLISAVGERAGIPYVVKGQGDFYFKDGNLIWFRNIKPQLNSSYLNYWIKSNIGQQTLGNIMIGSAQKALTIVGLKNLKIPLPSPEYQMAVCETLISLDTKIDLLHRQNTTLETLAATLFMQWFVEEAEESWEKVKIEELFVLQRGFDLPSQNRSNGIYPIIASNGINGFHDEFKVKGPGVTTGRSGVLGKVIYTQEDFWPLNTTLFIKEYRKATPLFAYYFLKTLDLETLNGGSAVPTLNRNHVHEIETVVPSENRIIEFENLVKNNFQKIKSNTTQIKTLTQLRDTLLPKLMSGEVRINN